MKRHLSIGLGIALSVAGISAAQAQEQAPQSSLVERGEYLTRAADCVVCHTKPGGAAFAGGLSFKTPFGTMFSSNITADRETGIGSWSDADFIAAVKHGKRPDGANLYPSMPYTSYVKLTDDDARAIRAYLMSLPAVKQKPPENIMGFPYNQRWSLTFWNLLNFRDEPFKADETKSAVWNRGAYVEAALGHCEECHTPRNVLMGLKASARFAGNEIDGWNAFNISTDPKSGIGSWSKPELVAYLHDGAIPGKASAGGAMADVVSHSLRYMTPEDLDALATYLQAQAPQAADATADRSSFAGKGPADIEAIRGLAPSDTPSGAELFNANCAACHGLNAQGIGEKNYYPSLPHNSVTGASTDNNLVQVVLNGIDRVNSKGEHIVMPAFGHDLTDAEISSLSNYVFQKFGNSKTSTSPELVAKLREAEVTVIPGWLLVGGGGVAGIVVILLGLFLLRKKRG